MIDDRMKSERRFPSLSRRSLIVAWRWLRAGLKPRDLVIAGIVIGFSLAAVLVKLITGWPNLGIIAALNLLFAVLYYFGHFLWSRLFDEVGIVDTVNKDQVVSDMLGLGMNDEDKAGGSPPAHGEGGSR